MSGRISPSSSSSGSPSGLPSCTSSTSSTSMPTRPSLSPSTTSHSLGASGVLPSNRGPLSAVTSTPCTLASPRTAPGAPGKRVTGDAATTCRTAETGSAKRSLPTRQTKTRSRAASVIGSKPEEAKIGKRPCRINLRFSARCLNERGPELGGPLGCKNQALPRDRVAEPKFGSVQGLARGRSLDPLGGETPRPGDPAGPPGAVDRIANHRMTGVGEVNPDLVGTAAVELAAQQLTHAEATDHVDVGSGGATVGAHDHPLAVGGAAADGGFDHRRRRAEVSPRESGIGALDLPRRERGPELAVGEVPLGDQHEAAGVRVQEA